MPKIKIPKIPIRVVHFFKHPAARDTSVQRAFTISRARAADRLLGFDTLSNNETVKQLKQHLASIQGVMRRQLDAKLREEAERLAQSIRSSIHGSRTGQLRESIRVVKGPHGIESSPVWFVVGGGELTTRVTNGVPYDYALAIEFGTEKYTAQPFFYPTFRRERNAIQARIDQLLLDQWDVQKSHL